MRGRLSRRSPAALRRSPRRAVPRPFPMPTGAPPPRRPRPHGARRRPTPPPIARRRRRRPAARPAVDGYALVGTALALRGMPYRNGGTDPDGFDCSGFTQYVFAQYGIALPREVREQFRVGNAGRRPTISRPATCCSSRRPRPAPSHVAIAIGGDEFVHAPSSTGVVRVERLSSSYWSPRFLGARRVSN